ncbi:MAG: cupin domain-containing protein [Dehalococcoidia bacterium]
MREKLDSLPAAVESPAFSIRTTNWDGMAATVIETTEKVDMGPALKGLPDDMCPVPHYGYMLSGAAHLKYADGKEEVIGAGEIFAWPAPHTGWFEAGTKFVEFSPEAGFKQLLDHLRGGG